MAAAPTIMNQFTVNPGFALQDGATLFQALNLLFSAAIGIVAHAGGGQALATPLVAAINQIDTCATNADSVVLPPAIPGRQVRVNNNTGQTLQVFGVAANASNAGAGDTIIAQGSTAVIATATGVAQATGVETVYICSKLGQWKQGALT